MPSWTTKQKKKYFKVTPVQIVPDGGRAERLPSKCNRARGIRRLQQMLRTMEKVMSRIYDLQEFCAEQ